MHICLQTWPDNLLGLVPEEFYLHEEPRCLLRKISANETCISKCLLSWRVSLAWRRMRLGTAEGYFCPLFLLSSPKTPPPPRCHQMEDAGRKGLQQLQQKSRRFYLLQGREHSSPTGKGYGGLGCRCTKKGNYLFREIWLRTEPETQSACSWAFQPNQPHSPPTPKH